MLATEKRLLKKEVEERKGTLAVLLGQVAAGRASTVHPTQPLITPKPKIYPGPFSKLVRMWHKLITQEPNLTFEIWGVICVKVSK